MPDRVPQVLHPSAPGGRQQGGGRAATATHSAPSAQQAGRPPGARGGEGRPRATHACASATLMPTLQALRRSVAAGMHWKTISLAPLRLIGLQLVPCALSLSVTLARQPRQPCTLSISRPGRDAWRCRRLGCTASSRAATPQRTRGARTHTASHRDGQAPLSGAASALWSCTPAPAGAG